MLANTNPGGQRFPRRQNGAQRVPRLACAAARSPVTGALEGCWPRVVMCLISASHTAARTAAHREALTIVRSPRRRSLNPSRTYRHRDLAACDNHYRLSRARRPMHRGQAMTARRVCPVPGRVPGVTREVCGASWINGQQAQDRLASGEPRTPQTESSGEEKAGDRSQDRGSPAFRV